MLKNIVRTSTFVVRTSACVRIYPADVFLPADRFLPSAPTIQNTSASKNRSVRTHSSVHMDAGLVRADAADPSLASLLFVPRPPPPASRPHGRSLLSAQTGCVRADARKYISIFFGSCFWLEKKKKIRFSIFNSQDPRIPKTSRAKPREEEGFFGLVPLVTHPSSIPLLGGLTPKFLSLSFHSL
jgi:hypothetical protein